MSLYFFSLTLNGAEVAIRGIRVIVTVEYSKTDHRWTDARNKRRCSVCVQISTFMEWVGYRMTHLTMSLYEEESFSTTSIMPFHNSSNGLDFFFFQTKDPSSTQIFIDNRLPFSPLIGFQMSRAADEKMNMKRCVRIPVKSVSFPQTLCAWPSLWWIND